MSEKIAQFRFLKYKILYSEVKIAEAEDISNTLTVSFNQTSSVLEQDRIYKHTLNASIFNENKSIEINVIAVGYFEFDAELEENRKNIFFKTNAPAILFPYVRAYISTLTSLSGINPLILPTLNLSQRD